KPCVTTAWHCLTACATSSCEWQTFPCCQPPANRVAPQFYGRVSPGTGLVKRPLIRIIPAVDRRVAQLSRALRSGRSGRRFASSHVVYFPSLFVFPNFELVRVPPPEAPTFLYP